MLLYNILFLSREFTNKHVSSNLNAFCRDNVRLYRFTVFFVFKTCQSTYFKLPITLCWQRKIHTKHIVNERNSNRKERNFSQTTHKKASRYLINCAIKRNFYCWHVETVDVRKRRKKMVMKSKSEYHQNSPNEIRWEWRAKKTYTTFDEGKKIIE